MLVDKHFNQTVWLWSCIDHCLIFFCWAHSIQSLETVSCNGIAIRLPLQNRVRVSFADLESLFPVLEPNVIMYSIAWLRFEKQYTYIICLTSLALRSTDIIESNERWKPFPPTDRLTVPISIGTVTGQYLRSIGTVLERNWDSFSPRGLSLLW